MTCTFVVAWNVPEQTYKMSVIRCLPPYIEGIASTELAPGFASNERMLKDNQQKSSKETSKLGANAIWNLFSKCPHFNKIFPT